MRLELDSAGLHALVFEEGEVRLVHGTGDLHSPLSAALERHLRLRRGNELLSFDAHGRMPLREAGDCEVLLEGAPPTRLARLRLGEDERVESQAVLSPFEARYLADNGFPHPTSGRISEHPGWTPTTDLHAHYSGCPRPEDLLRVGESRGIAYPAELLGKAAILVEREVGLPIAEMAPGLRAALVRQLALPADRRWTFEDLERVYHLRSPVTKREDCFVPLLWQVASDYAAMGVSYAELSLGSIWQSAWLTAAHGEAPIIEARLGVRLRFLTAISRFNDREWDLDLLDRIESLADSRLLVGVDFMGHETNSTRGFAWQLERLAQWAHRERPGFVIRVHAGENPAYPENVRVAAESVGDREVCLRIGHGLYGVDGDTLRLLAKRSAWVEFNLSSNMALNNIQSSSEVPLRQYLAQGLGCVLGTDGYGVYGTTAALEARAARVSGLDEERISQIAEAEQRYLRRREQWDAPLPATFKVPANPLAHHFTPEVLERGQRERAARRDAFRCALEARGIALLGGADTDRRLEGKRCLSIAGAWKKAWAALEEGDRARIRTFVAEVVAGLDPDTTVLVTGGTLHGVEGEVHRHARLRGLPVLAALVEDSPLDAIDLGIHLAFLVGVRFHDKAAGLYSMMKRHNGLCLFIGGGNVVNDEVQTAANLRVRYLLLRDVAGASGAHALQKAHRACGAAAEVLAKLDDSKYFAAAHEAFWHLGPNPTVDVAVFRVAPSGSGLQVLLIRRHRDSPAEPGLWAIPGGFVVTAAERGTPWRAGRETTLQAATRELHEETGLDLRNHESWHCHVGDFEGEGRDIRDTPSAWSRTSLFVVHLPLPMAGAPLAAGDDAEDCRWFDLERVPVPLAFDHARLLREAVKRLPQR